MKSSRISKTYLSVSCFQRNVLRSIIFTMLVVLSVCQAYAVTDATTPDERDTAFEMRQTMHQEGLFHDLAFRCVGPVVMSGRVI